MNATQRSDRPVYLRPEVKMEPLIDRWYAWSHLLAPAQHAMNLAYRYLPLLQSFVMNPAVHVAATRDPKLFGGPFVSLPKEEVGRVKELLETTSARSTCALRLAKDLKDFDAILQEQARGYSLNEFYARLPESLRGVVELVYDLNNHPKLRLHEELLYEERLASAREEVVLSCVPERERHFFMSTPRLGMPGELTLPVRFDDARLDALCSSRSRPRPLSEMCGLFELSDAEQPLYESFFTSEPPASRAAEYAGEAVRVRYFGHACVLVQTSEVSLLFDPMLAFEVGHDGRHAFADLPERIDYVVLSHNHQDHCAPEMLMQLRHRVGTVIVPRNNAGSLCDPSMKLILRRLGFADVEVADDFDTWQLPQGSLTSLPFAGEHTDLDIHTKQALFLSLKGRGIMLLVDSDGWDASLYRRVMAKLDHRVDLLFLGMECHGAPLTWLYGPLLSQRITRKDDESRRLSGANCERAWNVLQEIKAPAVCIYAMGQEPWLRFIMGLEYGPDSIQLRESEQFIARCSQAGVRAERLYLGAEFLLD